MASRPARPRRAPRRVKLKTPPLLYEKTQALFDRIQKKVDGTFLTYWTSTSGSVCDNDVMALHALLEAKGRQERIALLVKSDGGSGMASLRLVHLLRRYAGRRHGDRAPQLRLRRHHAGPRRRHDPDGAAVVPHRGRHLARARPLAARPHEPARPGQQRRGGPRHPAVEGHGRTARRRGEPLPGALQVRSPAGHRRPRPREQPLPHALPRDPRLPHEGPRGRPSASPAGSTPPTPPTSTRSPAARPGGWGCGCRTSRRTSTRSSRS